MRERLKARWQTLFISMQAKKYKIDAYRSALDFAHGFHKTKLNAVRPQKSEET
jgi:hypothetical protein